MQMGRRQAERFVENFLETVKDPTFCIGIAPSFTSIEPVLSRSGESFLKIGAQNVSQFSQGAYTGEVSSAFLNELGVHFVIIGHSERRIHFHEDNDTIHQKIEQVLNQTLIPVLCIGETEEERDRGKTREVLSCQLKGALKQFSKEDLSQLILAYEPVWAIGTGQTATPDEVQKIHESIRYFIKTEWDSELGDTIPILYGGSVTPDNARALLEKPDVDGVLVGGASLKVDLFVALIQKVQEVKL